MQFCTVGYPASYRGKLTSGNITAKFFWLQPEIMGTSRIKVSMFNVPVDFIYFLSVYRHIEEVTPAKSQFSCPRSQPTSWVYPLTSERRKIISTEKLPTTTEEMDISFNLKRCRNSKEGSLKKLFIVLYIDFWRANQGGFQKCDVQLCCKVNKEQQKCHVNCMGRIVLVGWRKNVWAVEKYIITEVFNPSVQSGRAVSRVDESHHLAISLEWGRWPLGCKTALYQALMTKVWRSKVLNMSISTWCKL